MEGAQVFHVRRDCSAIRHSNLVLEIQKCSACWGRNEMDTTGEMVVADGTGHRRDLPHRVDEGRTLRPCERCKPKDSIIYIYIYKHIRIYDIYISLVFVS